MNAKVCVYVCDSYHAVTAELIQMNLGINIDRDLKYHLGYTILLFR